MKKFLGKCLFVSWFEADKIADEWAKNHFGTDVKACAQREGTDVSILVTHLCHSDYAAHCAACAKDDEFDPEENFGTFGGHDGISAVEPGSVLLDAIVKSYGDHTLSSANHSVSTEDGIYIMEGSMDFDDYAIISKEG